jgi:CHAD domain-containing protein
MTDNAGSTSLEIERKYEVIGDAPMPEVHLPGAVSVVESRVPLVAKYWDTPTRELERAGLALRSRSGGADAGWHVKARGAEGVLEIHWPAADEIPSGAIAALSERLGPLAGTVELAGALAPVATVCSDRIARRLLGADGELLVEFADDRVFSIDHAAGGAGERAWREWEAELGEGADPELLAIANECLLAAGARPSLSDAKIQRALGMAVPAAWQRRAPLSELLACALIDIADRIDAADAVLRADGAGAVRHVRALVRRARDLIELFGRHLDVAAAERQTTVQQLQSLGFLLGAVRDAEVLAARADRLLAAEPAAAGLRRVRRLVVDVADQERADAVAVLIEAIDPHASGSLAPTVVASQLRLLAYGAVTQHTPSLPADPDPTRAETITADTITAETMTAEATTPDPIETIAARLEGRLRKIVRRFAKFEATMIDSEDGMPRAAGRLHALRTQVRRVRFVAEELGEAKGAQPRPLVSVDFATDAHAVQSLLGEFRDARILAERLDALAEASIAHPSTDAAAQLAERLATDARTAAVHALAQTSAAITRLQAHKLNA